MLMAPFLLAGGRAAMFLVIPLCGVVLVRGHLSPRGAASSAGVGAGVGARHRVEPDRSVSGDAADERRAGRRVLDAGARRGDVGRAPRGAAARGRLRRGVAILIRPNLLPLGFVVGVYLWLRPDRPWPERVRARRASTPPPAPWGAWRSRSIQRHFYGSPLASGYGAVGDIFALAHVAPNASRYGSWLRAGADAAGAAGAWRAVRAAARLRGCWVWPSAPSTLGVYLPYLVFEDWSYVRFLLPAMPVLTVLMLGTLAGLVRRVSARAGGHGAGASPRVVLVVAGVWTARDASGVSRSRQLESVFARTGDVVGRRLPGNALVVTSRYSGSVRYYARPRDARLGRARSRVARSRGGVRARAAGSSRSSCSTAARRRRSAQRFAGSAARAARLAAAHRDRAAGAHLRPGRSRALPARRAARHRVRAMMAGACC